MAERAFPVLFAEHVSLTAAFYESLGFARHFQLPPDGEPGYVGLRRGSYELAVVSAEWPQQQYNAPVGPGGRFEMFVYVTDVDQMVGRLRGDGTTILREPADMPWGERVAYVADPDGNPVALAAAPAGTAPAP
jgi:lactoylglutathione lyase